MTLVDATQKKYLGAGLAALAVVFLLLALFLAWWTVQVEAGGTEDQEGLKPFEGGESETAVTGIFAVLAFLAALAVGALLVGHAFAIPKLSEFPVSWSVVGAGAAAVFAVAALVVTATSWPDEDQKFWGEESFSSAGGSFGGFSFPGSSATFTYSPGVGWWLELLGALALAGGAVLAWMAAQGASVPKKKTRAAKPAA